MNRSSLSVIEFSAGA